MRDLDEHSITQAVLEKVANGKSPRARTISNALIRHLHAFVREIEPTEKEWEQAIQFLTETGQMCTDRRQEFILLSDALGVSMLIDAINHRAPGEATETTVFGPFFVPEAPEVSSGAHIAGDLGGPPFHVSGRVMNTVGEPVAGAIVDVWHADSDGFYDVQYEGQRRMGGRCRIETDHQGAFDFHTVLPSPYPIPHDGPVGRMLEAQGRHPFRPAHVHFMIVAPGYSKLVTHLFLMGSDYLDSDVVFGVKESLIRPVEVVETAFDAPDLRAFFLRADFRLSPPLATSA